MLIAQISDLHLRTDGSLLQDRIDTRQALENCIAHVNGLDPRPELVLATGDLVDLALAEDYPVLRRALSRLEMPVYVIPGNHDDRDAMRRAFGDLGYFPEEGGFLNYTVEEYPLRMIGIDTLLPGRGERRTVRGTGCVGSPTGLPNNRNGPR